jgi:type II secretion system protein G
MQKKGFTLIELLIVVAIIAILAAIAVPNFIEAQTRSKISRVKADMRTLATAMESYVVDNNDIPNRNRGVDTGFFDIQPVTPSLPASMLYRPAQLTTPISYISSFPIDPFNSLVFRGFTGVNAGNVSSWYTCSSIKLGPFPDVLLPNHQAWADWPGGRFYYILCSCGPDGQWDTTTDTRTFYYDPTNGTTSRGDIYYYGHKGLKGGSGS